MASTSAFEIGFAAAAETVDVPADAAEALAAVAVDGEGAEVPFAEPADGEGAGEAAAPVTLAACLEPKMADTILPKTLIFLLLALHLLSGLRPLPAIPKEGLPLRGAYASKGAPCPLGSRYSGILSQLPSDLIAVFVGVYAFLIYGLVSIADAHFTQVSYYHCSVAFPAIVSVLHLARPSEQHRRH